MLSVLDTKVNILELASVIEVCPGEMSDKSLFLAPKVPGRIVLLNRTNSRRFDLNVSRGQLAALCREARTFDGLLCMRRFGWGEGSDERRWVELNGPLLLDSRIQVCGQWRQMLDPSFRCVSVSSEQDLLCKSSFLDGLAAALQTIGCGPQSTYLVPNLNAPLHWLREFASDLDFNLTVVRGESSMSKWFRDDFLEWLSTDRLVFSRQGFKFSDGACKS